MITPKQLAQALLVDTCHSLCALVALSDHQEIISLHVFDPHYHDGKVEIHSGVSEVWLIANHEDGNADPMDDEWRILDRVAMRMPGVAVRYFLSSEYWPCREICLVQRCCSVI